MAKTPETYEKAAAYFKKVGDRSWAKGRNDPEKGYEFERARGSYESARRAMKGAARLRGEQEK